MNVGAFLYALEARGIAVRLNRDKIAARPVALLTIEDREMMAASKPAIIAYLTPVLVHSETVGESVRVVEVLDSPPTLPGDGEPVTYTRIELERMQGLAPESVRAIHTSKRHFGGTYIGPSE